MKRLILVNLVSLLVIIGDIVYMLLTKNNLTLFLWLFLYTLFPIMGIFVNGFISGIVAYGNKFRYIVSSVNSCIIMLALYIASFRFTGDVIKRIIGNSQNVEISTVKLNSGVSVQSIVMTIVIVISISVFGTFAGSKLPYRINKKRQFMRCDMKY